MLRMLRRTVKSCRGRLIGSARRFTSSGTYCRGQSAAIDTAPSTNNSSSDPRAIYVHLPFCKRKCFYCDFPVVAVGGSTSGDHVQAQMSQYVEAVCEEINACKRIGKSSVDSVYFGGGTPSLVPVELVHQILRALDDKFGIHEDAEISLEADPGTFDDARLTQYVSIGVTRISMGVQAFQQELLDACGRSHNIEDVHDAIQTVKNCGVASWSLDLISGLPNLTMSSWRHSLQEAINARPDHISVYDLQVEEGTPFARWYEQGRLSFPRDDDAATMYAEAVAMLTSAGYEHYEVSNYAKPGHRSRHNQAYWRGVPYYAFGVGAASYLEGHRFSRPSKVKDYLSWVRSLQSETSTTMPLASQEDAMLDSIMLRLRTSDGLDMHAFSRCFGPDAATAVCTAMEPHLKSGLAMRLPRLDGEQYQESGSQRTPGRDSNIHNAWDFRFRLSDPHGFLFSNDIISDVFAAFSFK